MTLCISVYNILCVVYLLVVFSFLKVSTFNIHFDSNITRYLINTG